jgi:histidinol dehydrogenase
MIPVLSYRTGETPDRLADILERADVTWDDAVERSVAELLADVRTRGDEAVIELTKKFDRAELTPKTLRVPVEECQRALDALDPSLRDALTAAIDNVRRFHEHQKRTSWSVDDGDGVILGKRFTPVDAAGLWVPGGAAPLISSLYMNAVPAQVAGVERIIMCTPPRPDGMVDPAMLATAALVGVEEVYRMGGVMAIGAMAYGTSTISPVDVIVGPGNQYVQAAKKAVIGTVGIDMVAGPSEIVVIADETARADWIAADMLSQAEHGSGFEASVAIVTSEELALQIVAEIEKQTNERSRDKTIRTAIERFGGVFVVENLETACELSNRIAPEHLEVQTADPWALVDHIRHAGAIFLGAASTEPVGDYYAGTNHVLPTGRAARFASSLSVDDFVKSSSIVSYTAKRLTKTASDIMAIAHAEGLDAHAHAAGIRVENGNKS